MAFSDRARSALGRLGLSESVVEQTVRDIEWAEMREVQRSRRPDPKEIQKIHEQRDRRVAKLKELNERADKAFARFSKGS